MSASPTGHPPIPQLGRLRRELRLLLAACVLGALLCLLLWRTAQARDVEAAEREVRATRLAASAQRIEQLRRQPSQARESMLPNADLLERVARWMQSAAIEKQTLVSTSVLPLRTVPGASHAEVVQRLTFERVRIEQLVRFCHHARGDAPELRISGLQLRPGNEPAAWSADVSLAYRIVVGR